MRHRKLFMKNRLQLLNQFDFFLRMSSSIRVLLDLILFDTNLNLRQWKFKTRNSRSFRLQFKNQVIDVQRRVMRHLVDYLTRHLKDYFSQTIVSILDATQISFRLNVITLLLFKRFFARFMFLTLVMKIVFASSSNWLCDVVSDLQLIEMRVRFVESYTILLRI